MTELIKTLIYAGVALLVLSVALLVRFWPTGEKVDVIIGELLFPEFKDPLEAQSLEIARYDDVINQVNRFTVNRASGRWVIPSHGNYPADADEQMKNAATSLIGLEILDSVTDRASDHEVYGVVEPNSEKLERGDKGVGVQVSFKDKKGSPLGELIIGVDQLEGGRFVRRPGQSHVFVTKIDLSKFSTKFEDWIEKDLLKIEPTAIEEITFNDYSVLLNQATGRPRRERRMLMTVKKGTGGWNLERMTRFREQEAVELPLASSEELNSEQLDSLTRALDELVIVDVRRKPKELGADLRTDQGIQMNQETYDSLFSKGYIAALAGDEQNPYIELLSKNGDLIVETKEGVQYLLRFGDLAESKDTSELGKLNRYLMVACSVSEDKYPKPTPPKLPELPAGPAPAPGKPMPPAGAAGNAADSASDAAADGTTSGGDEDEQQDEAPAADAKNDETKPDETTPDETKSDETKPDEAKPNEEEPELDAIKIQAERTRLQKQYEAELEAWREKRRGAVEKVRELNARFADWYYVIPEDVYAKIHLGRGELIKEKANVAVEGNGLDAFRYLETNGPDLPPDAGQSAAPGSPNFSFPPG